MSGVGLDAKPASSGRSARAVLLQADTLLTAARTVIADHAQARTEIQAALSPLKDALVRRELDGIPVSRLKDVTEGRLRLGALEQAGYATVRQVLDARPYALQQIPGIGAQSANQAVAAARQIAAAAAEHVAVRIDIDATGDARTTALVAALNRLVNAGPDIPRAVDAAARIDAGLAPLLAAARPARNRLRILLSGKERRQQALDAVQQIGALLADAAERAVPLLLAQAAADLLRPSEPADEAWLDFQVRPAEYTVLLSEVAGLAADVKAAEGFLPGGISDRVRAQRLDDTHRRVSLRGYQAFGARFALAQRRVVLGDVVSTKYVSHIGHVSLEGGRPRHREFPPIVQRVA
jgi:hypothetical protein